ncbi:unnamed protein product [Hermetia illucens]|uniref:Uncharacterized protein n=1 Tax=Hermetia illucens TaxID=343691 RepID=A0A7R8UF40_HERIL|nr:unnamed protein product [Hermetia illucens]
MVVDILDSLLFDDSLLNHTESHFKDLPLLEGSELEAYFLEKDTVDEGLNINPFPVECLSEYQHTELDGFTIPYVCADEDPELDLSNILSESQIEFLENEVLSEALVVFGNDELFIWDVGSSLHLEMSASPSSNLSTDITASNTECGSTDIDTLCEELRRLLRLEFREGRDYSNAVDYIRYNFDGEEERDFHEKRKSWYPYVSFDEETEYWYTGGGVSPIFLTQSAVEICSDPDLSDVLEIWSRIDWGQSSCS